MASWGKAHSNAHGFSQSWLFAFLALLFIDHALHILERNIAELWDGAEQILWFDNSTDMAFAQIK